MYYFEQALRLHQSYYYAPWNLNRLPVYHAQDNWIMSYRSGPVSDTFHWAGWLRAKLISGCTYLHAWICPHRIKPTEFQTRGLARTIFFIKHNLLILTTIHVSPQLYMSTSPNSFISFHILFSPSFHFRPLLPVFRLVPCQGLSCQHGYITLSLFFLACPNQCDLLFLNIGTVDSTTKPLQRASHSLLYLFSSCQVTRVAFSSFI